MSDRVLAPLRARVELTEDELEALVVILDQPAYRGNRQAITANAKFGYALRNIYK